MATSLSDLIYPPSNHLGCIVECYTVSMLYIVGLGNPGEEYEKTRHNAGFLALDYLTLKFNLPQAVKNSQQSGLISEGVIAETPVTLLYPTTQMNNSGHAVKKLLTTNSATPAELLLIYDDIDIALGSFKLSFGRGAGGHNGLQSVIDVLGTKDFKRIRIGVAKQGSFFRRFIRPRGQAMAKYVLSPFSVREQKSLEPVFATVSEVVLATIVHNWEKTMSQFN